MIAIGATAYGVGVLSIVANLWNGGGMWSYLGASGGPRVYEHTEAEQVKCGDPAEQSQCKLGDDIGDGCGHGNFMAVSVSCQCPAANFVCPTVECSCPVVECSCSCGETRGLEDYNMSADFRWAELFREPGFTFSWFSWGTLCWFLARCMPAAFGRRAAAPRVILESEFCRYATQMPSPDRRGSTPVRPVRRAGHVA